MTLWVRRVKVLFKVTDDAGETIQSNQSRFGEDAIQLDALTEWGGLSRSRQLDRSFVCNPDDKPLPNHHINEKKSGTTRMAESKLKPMTMALHSFKSIQANRSMWSSHRCLIAFLHQKTQEWYAHSMCPMESLFQLQTVPEFFKSSKANSTCRRFTTNGTRGTVIDLAFLW